MKLNPKQQEAVDHSEGPLLIIAGAGSGKTKTLTSRIIKLLETGVAPERILAITFTNKAAAEMKRRVIAVGNSQKISPGLFIGTFHSFGALMLRKEARYFERTPGFSIFDASDSLSLIRKIIKSINSDKGQKKPATIAYNISRIKSEMAPDDDELTMEIYRRYEQALVKNNAFDFDDLIEKPVKLLTKNDQARKKYQERYKYVLVDEFQDTNVAQYRLVKLLAQNHKNLNVVGDDAQAIYGWRHADFRNFLNFEKDWGETKVIKLEENYRSTQNIIRAANVLIKNNKLQKEKDLWTDNPIGGLIQVIEAGDEDQEAGWIVDKIKSLKHKNTRTQEQTGGGALEETAILYRTNAQSRAIEQQLIYDRIPYQIFGGIRFYERKEIKDIMAGLRLATNPQDEISFDRIKKTFSKGKSALLLEEMPKLTERLSVVQLIDYFINNTDYITYLANNFKNSEERLENIKELMEFASNEPNLKDFLERASLTQVHDQPQGNQGVKLMTTHMAKGLEFDDVFVSGCSEGLLPHQKSYNSMEELEEERRLMYVAVTRARKNLFLTFNGPASRFLYEMPPELMEFKSLTVNKRDYLINEEEGWISYD